MDNPIVRLLRFLLVEQWPITLTVALGFVAVYLLLPRPRAAARAWGAAAGGLALVLAGALAVRAGRFDPETVLFYAFSGIAVVAGGLLVTQSNPARAALSFALVVLSTCGLFLLQAAPFLTAATTIIYAGAIVVTFLFVIMLAQQEGPSDADQRSREPLLSSLTGFVLLGALLYVLQAGYGTREIDSTLAKVRQAKEKDTTTDMARALGIDADDADTRQKLAEKFFRDFNTQQVQRSHALASVDPPRPLSGELDNVLSAWLAAYNGNDVEKARKAWERFDEIGLRARASLGALQPAVPEKEMSNLSGPPANQPLFQPLPDPDGKAPPPVDSLRRDTDGRPQLPHENTAYLGRALFTDYLLAVELGGTLLLVATVGAITIAGRRGGRSA